MADADTEEALAEFDFLVTEGGEGAGEARSHGDGEWGKCLMNAFRFVFTIDGEFIHLNGCSVFVENANLRQFTRMFWKQNTECCLTLSKKNLFHPMFVPDTSLFLTGMSIHTAGCPVVFGCCTLQL